MSETAEIGQKTEGILGVRKRRFEAILSLKSSKNFRG
jgi:hypothetical protein